MKGAEVGMMLFEVRISRPDCWVLCKLDGSSFNLRESCLLNGERLASCEKPLKDPCLSSIFGGACGLSIAWGFGPDDVVEGWDVGPALGGGDKDFVLIVSVAELTLKLPDLVKVDDFESNVMLTPHSFSRFCFLSKHTAKAHPTAWLNRSPCYQYKNIFNIY